VRQVSHLPELYEDARSEKYKPYTRTTVFPNQGIVGDSARNREINTSTFRNFEVPQLISNITQKTRKVIELFFCSVSWQAVFYK